MENQEQKSNINNDEQIKAEAIQALSGSPIIDPSGWIEIKKEKLSYDGKLYNHDYRFAVKPVNAGLLKYFSTLDETNAMSVQDALMYVVKHHVRVFQGKKLLDSLDVVYEHDRLFFTLLVHEYSGSPTNLVIEATNPSKDKQEVIVTPQALVFNEISEKGLSYLNSKTGVFDIKTKSLGVLKYKPLTINQALMLTEFIYKKSQDKEEIEALFIQSASFFINENNENDPQKIYMEYYKATQDMKFASVILEILKIIKIDLVLEFKATDPKTKLPFRAPVTSLRGIKDIFLVSDSASELQ